MHRLVQYCMQTLADVTHNDYYTTEWWKHNASAGVTRQGISWETSIMSNAVDCKNAIANIAQRGSSLAELSAP